MNWNLFLILLLILIILLFSDTNENFSVQKYRIIIVQNDNLIIIHIKDDNHTKIFKIYKNKLNYL